MISLKSKEEIKILAAGGMRLALVMKELKKSIRSGITAYELDRLCESLIFYYGGKPSFKNYKPENTAKSFPASLCVSINDVIVHGIPKKEIILKQGDVVSLDAGMLYPASFPDEERKRFDKSIIKNNSLNNNLSSCWKKNGASKGLYTDMAITCAIGKIPRKVNKLIRVVKKSLDLAIKAAKPGNTLGDIGFAIYRHISKNSFSVVYNLTGHGVGFAVHEDPFVFNFGAPGEGIKLKEGMVLAIEPMASMGKPDIIQDKDGSFKTADGSLSAHFEHTIAIVKGGSLVLTKD